MEVLLAKHNFSQLNEGLSCHLSDDIWRPRNQVLYYVAMKRRAVLEKQTFAKTALYIDQGTVTLESVMSPITGWHTMNRQMCTHTCALNTEGTCHVDELCFVSARIGCEVWPGSLQDSNPAALWCLSKTPTPGLTSPEFKDDNGSLYCIVLLHAHAMASLCPSWTHRPFVSFNLVGLELEGSNSTNRYHPSNSPRPCASGCVETSCSTLSSSANQEYLSFLSLTSLGIQAGWMLAPYSRLKPPREPRGEFPKSY